MSKKDKGDKHELVPARTVVEMFGIPRAVLYRLVAAGRIPAHRHQRQPWHTRPSFLFDLEEKK